MATLKSVIKCWREFNLPRLQKTLDEEAAQIGDRQDGAEQSRKKLIVLTKDFKKNTEEDVRKKVSPLIKALQGEVDSLNRRSKAAESSFLSLYKKVLEVPDPVPVLDQAQSIQQQLSKAKDLELENKKLRETLDEYHVEFAEVKNQDVTIKDLREKIKEYEEKADERIQVKLKDREAELQKDFIEREKQLQDMQVDVATQLSEAENKIKNLQKALEEAQAELFDAKSKGEEDIAARASEMELLEDDLERASQRALSAEKYAESLREQLTQALEARKDDFAEEQTLNQRLSSVTTSSLEIELTAKERELSQIVEEVHHLQSSLNRTRETSKKEIISLEEQVAEKSTTIETLKQKLRRQEDYEEIKRELDVLKMIEVGGIADSGSKPKSLEKLLLEKNKGLQTDNTNLKLQKNNLSTRCDDLQRQCTESFRTIKEQKELIVELEHDVLNLNNFPSLYRGQGEGEATPNSESELVEKAVLEVQKEENPKGTPSSESLLSIVSSQRERFRTRNLELEAQTRHQQQQITVLHSEVDRMRSDNVKLYEKIKFLQSYPTQTTSVNIEDDSVKRYSSQYEERIDPFSAFSKRERQQRYVNLSAPEKVTLNMGRFILSNKIARTIVFFYTIILHLLVFLVLYKMAYTESCKREIASDCARKFAEHMNQVHHQESDHHH